MLKVMHGIARKVYGVRNLFLVFALALGFVFIYISINNSVSLDVYLLPCVTLFGWVVCLYGIAVGFINAPPVVSRRDNFIRRMINRVRFAIAWFWALLFTLCTFGLFYTSYSTVKFTLSAS